MPDHQHYQMEHDCRGKALQHYVPSRGEALAEVIVDRYAAAADFRGDRKGCRCEAHWNKPVASVRRFVPVCGTVFGRPR